MKDELSLYSHPEEYKRYYTLHQKDQHLISGIMDLEHSDEMILIEQLVNGSVAAFDQLYRNHSKKLLRNVFYQVMDMDIAKDIVQEVFLNLWNKRAYIDPARPLKPYLNVTAKYMIIDYYRKMAGSEKMVKILLIGAVDFHTHAEDDLDYKETLVLLDKAIATLTPQQQVVYRKCRLEGKSHEEIANELGISKATVNNHIVKANRCIIEYMRKYDSMVILVFTYVLLSR